jgi:hypothetical protein
MSSIGSWTSSCRALPLLVAAVAIPRWASAEDGGNDVCPAIFVEADDVRERYDEQGRLVRQLRLHDNRYVQEIAIGYRDGHAVERTESVPGSRRVALTTYDGDQLVSAECRVDGLLTARARYFYDGDRRVRLEKGGARGELLETTRFFYDASGQLIATEVRGADGKVVNATHIEREPLQVPIRFSLSAGGSYQSDTELYDFSAGLGVHRIPRPEQYAFDPLDVRLDASFKFHRAAGITTTDQTAMRFSGDYHDIVPRLTLFTFTATERNLPANLRLNLELAVLGAKLEILRDQYQLDVSFAPIWNYRSINSPTSAEPDSPVVVEDTSKVRGSFRARAGIRRDTWSLLDTFEFLPTLYGDDIDPEDDFWDRTVLRNTVTLDVRLAGHLTFREEFKYTRDPAMRAQASCPDDSNALCRGYSFTSTTSIVLDLEL